MSFWQFLTILKARWKIAASVFLGTVFVAVLLSLVLPKKYTATTSLVVDLKSPDPITGMVMQGVLTASVMATQMDVLQSPRVAKRVIESLRLADSSELRDEWQEATEGQGLIEDWLAELLLKQLDIKPSRESNVMFVSYTSPDPAFAAALANSFAQSYVDTALALRVQPAREYNRFFDVQSKITREALESAQSKLSAFQQARGLLVTEERLDLENARLAELTAQMVQTQGQANESVSRQAQVRRSGEQLEEVTNNPVVAHLKTQLAASRAKLSELRQRFGEKHPSVQEVRATIDELQFRIREETGTLTGGVAVANQINQQRVKQLDVLIAQQRGKVMKMKADRDEAAVLQRDVENAQRAYEAIFNRANQTNLESQTQLSNVSVLSAAPLPLLPSSPKLLLNTVIAVFVGGLLAIATAMLKELLDRRVRSSTDAVEAVGLGVLGVLPRPGQSKPRKRNVLLAQQPALVHMKSSDTA